MSIQLYIALIIACAAAVAGSVYFFKTSGTQSESSSMVKWTVIMAIASWVGVATAIWSVWQLRTDLREVVNATISLELDKEFDSIEMRRARRVLATRLLNGQINMSDTRVLDFFEKVATYQRLERVDSYTTDSSFSYFIERYWIATQTGISDFRRRQNDSAYYQDFERLNADMLAREARERHRSIFEITPRPSEVERFLREEAAIQ